MSVAIYMAEQSTCRMRHGAVVVKGGRVLSTGVNKLKNHPLNVSEEHIKKCSVHAEVDAVKKASNPRGATVYVARINKRGDEMLSRPCNKCYEYLIQSGIKKIIYTI